MNVKAILKNNRHFLLPYLIFIVLGIILIVMNSKASMHLEFNTFHSPFFDTIFFYITYLGDGITATLVGMMLLAVRFRYAFIVGLSCLISAFITQLLKHTLFDGIVRPKQFFYGIHDLYFVPGVDNYLYNSFPSGHATCAFSLCLGLAVITKGNKLKFLYFAFALLIGYSRIYLSQHFFEDVYAGSVIGVTITLIVYYFFQKTKRTWVDKSAITIFR